jgi:tetratricopeptide (TPR) repeat protein
MIWSRPPKDWLKLLVIVFLAVILMGLIQAGFRPYTNSAANYASGLSKYEKGDFNGAVNEFTTAITISPRSDYFLHRGMAYEGKGDSRKAILDYEKALQGKEPWTHRSKAAARLDGLKRKP